ncbi:creatininase family protein [Cohnella suwonensis]|uniref:Creatininase family protein n=1 Tax=Cohnella suwonensis TaxID=696072 RepID=A0ABW0LXS7_9BACL
MKRSIGHKTLWSELLPHEFKTRLADNPTVYFPIGLCEPHGQVSAFGLDTIKAEWLCREAAERVGGIVAPSMGFHVHETGYHARWLEDEVGEVDAPMTGIPPGILLHLFLYQLRAFANAGFRNVVVVSGHSGGNQRDLRLAAELFMEHVPVNVWVRSDPELVEDLYEGDHAGKYEISQLMYLRPELIDMSAREYEKQPDSGGKLALGEDAAEANPELGESIMRACLQRLCDEAEKLQAQAEETAAAAPLPRIGYGTVEHIWAKVRAASPDWVTAKPWPGQPPVSEGSRWKPYENWPI